MASYPITWYSFIKFEPGDGNVWYITDLYPLENMLLLRTSDGRLATLDADPKPRVELLETESYYDPATGTEEHLVDVLTDDDCMVMKVSVMGTRIMGIMRLF